jgi:hypothetical protein
VEKSPQRSEKKQTLMENAADFTEELAEHAESYRYNTEFDLVYCAWALLQQSRLDPIFSNRSDA